MPAGKQISFPVPVIPALVSPAIISRPQYVGDPKPHIKNKQFSGMIVKVEM